MRDKAYSIGKAKNYNYFLEINKNYKCFDKITPCATPKMGHAIQEER